MSSLRFTTSQNNMETEMSREKLTRTDLQDIESALKSEIARMERIFGPIGVCVGDETIPDWSNAPVADGGIPISTGLAHRTERYEILKQALTRLRDGSYGLCMFCGSAIPRGRLLAIPDAVHCLSCGGNAA